MSHIALFSIYLPLKRVRYTNCPQSLFLHLPFNYLQSGFLSHHSTKCSCQGYQSLSVNQILRTFPSPFLTYLLYLTWLIAPYSLETFFTWLSGRVPSPDSSPTSLLADPSQSPFLIPHHLLDFYMLWLSQ